MRIAPPSPIMKASDVALRLGISVSKVYALAAAGKIPAHRVAERSWSFDRAEVEAYWEACRVAAPEPVPAVRVKMATRPADLTDQFGDVPSGWLP